MYMGAPACHSCATLRMINAQSKVTEPAGNAVRSSKYEEDTRSIARGATLQDTVLKTTPSRRLPDAAQFMYLSRNPMTFSGFRPNQL